MRTERSAGNTRLPRSRNELKSWLRLHFNLTPADEATLLEALEEVLRHQRQLIEGSKHDAMRALTEGFAGKLERMQRQLTEKESTVNSIARYFEEVVADLTEKSHRDPKTKLLNFDWFMERLESFLAVEQRVRWCGVGVVDITSFKSYNDTLGHHVGDRIIERVSRILGEQIRSQDYLAMDRPGQIRDLHARFGGDEFCFLIPDLPGFREAVEVAERFKRAVERHDWTAEDERLANRPVKVDVGVVSLRLGPISERRGVARRLAADLIQRADKLMYAAKAERATHVYPACVRVMDGELVDVPDPDRLPVPRSGATGTSDLNP